MDVFQEEYKKLNKEQRDAVESIDGPVMVVAGPGTGKTQILALRIANILQKTDIKADGILCLTFTNSAVEAMKARLSRYIGQASDNVNVLTFHSFGMKVIGEHFKVLGLLAAPKLLEDIDRAIFFEQILNENEWEYLRPRSDNMRYFRDLMSLSSILKRERISAADFALEVKKAIQFLESDESSIASRGENKGGIKKEVIKEIESLRRSVEIVKFLDLYEIAKKEKNLLDYDDVLENLVKLVETSDEVVSTIRERYLYVLVDEHQDSSRVQNEFLATVWTPLEKPEIFVVGDDRQLIYGFSGASIDHFKGFQKTFPEARLITLVNNYRSTQVILDASHALLQSVMSETKLISQNTEINKEIKSSSPVRLVEADNPEEEIIALGLDLKEKIKKELLSPNNCAVLVPKNRQVVNALNILHSLGIPVSTEAVDLFDQNEVYSLLRILKIINNGDKVSFVQSILDNTSGVPTLEAHKFLVQQNMREFSFEKLTNNAPNLFSGTDNVSIWVAKLKNWIDFSKNNNLESLILKIGEELFIDVKNNLVSPKEIIDTIIVLLKKQQEKNSHINLSEFIVFLDKLASYGEDVPLVSSNSEGVKVLTMHASKGLEFEYVWIAHMDEKSLSGSKRIGFTLPPTIKERIEENDIDAIKRKLYVAITRAKRWCTLSYSVNSKKGSEQELAKIIADLPSLVFEKIKFSASEKKLNLQEASSVQLKEIIQIAQNKYKDRYVSVSLLNNFFDCPWQWYFRNLLQVPEPQVETLEFGSAVHASIDEILKLRKNPKDINLEEIEEINQKTSGGNKEVLKIITKWVQTRLPNISTSRENEQSVSVKDNKFPHLNIYGRIDLIENLEGGGVRVTDFKTGSVRKRSDIEKLDEENRMSGNLRQLAMYSYLIKQSPKWKVDVSESRLEFLEAKNPQEAFYDRVITQKEIDLIVQDILDYDQFIKTGGWVNRPCNYNSYGKNTECGYCQLIETFKT